VNQQVITITSSICLCRQIIVLGDLSRTYLWKILLISKIKYSLCHCFVGRLSYGHSPSEILLSATVSPLSSRYTIAFNALRPIVWSLTACRAGGHEACTTGVMILIEILSRTTLLLLRGPVEVVKHEIHVSSLLYLKVVNNCFIPMDLYFYVCLSLAG